MAKGKRGMSRRDAAERGTACGFTLIEVLVALAIMAVAVTLAVQLFAANLRALFVSGDTISAAVLADTRLREIAADPPLGEKTWSEEQKNGYRMDISVAETLRERTDGLPVRLMELSLTVHWRAGVREKKLTLRTVKMVGREGPG